MIWVIRAMLILVRNLLPSELYPVLASAFRSNELIPDSQIFTLIITPQANDSTLRLIDAFSAVVQTLLQR